MPSCTACLFKPERFGPHCNLIQAVQGTKKGTPNGVPFSWTEVKLSALRLLR